MRRIATKVFKSGSILSVIAFFIVGLTIALSFDINRRINAMNANTAELRMFEQNLATLSTLRVDSIEASMLKPYLRSALPLRDELVSFRREMQQLSVKHQLPGYGFSFGNEVVATEDSAGFIRYDLSIRGSEEQILGFLRDLEAHPYYITMPSINYVEQELGDFQLTTSGRIYTRS